MFDMNSQNTYETNFYDNKLRTIDKYHTDVVITQSFTNSKHDLNIGAYPANWAQNRPNLLSKYKVVSDCKW